MDTVFLAYSFTTDDRELVDHVDRLLTSHGLRTITGKSLGGRALTPEVKERIDGADALVALLTRREQQPGGGWTTSDWVRDEFGYAQAQKKASMALIEDGVHLGGAHAQNEYIALDRAAPLEAILRLSETVYFWKEHLGRLVRVRLYPDDAAALAADEGTGVVCQYRFKDEKGVATAWEKGQVYEEAGGHFLYVRGVRERLHLQVSVIAPGRRWISPFEPYLMQATLQSRRTGQ